MEGSEVVNLMHACSKGGVECVAFHSNECSMHGHISQSTNLEDPTGEFLTDPGYCQAQISPPGSRDAECTSLASAHSRICSDLVLRQIEELNHVARALRRAFCESNVLGSLRGIVESRHMV